MRPVGTEAVGIGRTASTTVPPPEAASITQIPPSSAARSRMESSPTPAEARRQPPAVVRTRTSSDSPRRSERPDAGLGVPPYVGQRLLRDAVGGHSTAAGRSDRSPSASTTTVACPPGPAPGQPAPGPVRRGRRAQAVHQLANVLADGVHAPRSSSRSRSAEAGVGAPADPGMLIDIAMPVSAGRARRADRCAGGGAPPHAW